MMKIVTVLPGPRSRRMQPTRFWPPRVSSSIFIGTKVTTGASWSPGMT